MLFHQSTQPAFLGTIQFFVLPIFSPSFCFGNKSNKIFLTCIYTRIRRIYIYIYIPIYINITLYIIFVSIVSNSTLILDISSFTSATKLETKRNFLFLLFPLFFLFCFQKQLCFQFCCRVCYPYFYILFFLIYALCLP